MKKIVSNSGRIIFALPFLVFGIFHLMNSKGMAGMIPPFFPLSQAWVILTGICLICAAISLIITKYVKLSMLLLAVFLLLTILFVHIPAFNNPSMMEPTGLLKDLGLLGAALFFAADFWK